MSDIQIFENPAFGEVRALNIDGEPWFVGRDVCVTFGDANPNRSLGRIDEQDKTRYVIQTAGGPQETTLINESGLYALLFAMQPTKAHKGGTHMTPPSVQERIDKLHAFKRWVTSEVLPSIRAHGAYLTPETLEAALLNPDTLIKLATELKSEREARLALATDNAALSAQIALDAPKVRYADAVSGAAGGMLIREFCKFLKGNGKDIGEKRMFTDLRARGFLIKAKGRDYNKPTQRAMDMGLFTIRETAVEKPSGRVDTYTTPLLTGKGRQYFADLYLSPETDADAAKEG